MGSKLKKKLIKYGSIYIGFFILVYVIFISVYMTILGPVIAFANAVCEFFTGTVDAITSLWSEKPEEYDMKLINIMEGEMGVTFDNIEDLPYRSNEINTALGVDYYVDEDYRTLADKAKIDYVNKNATRSDVFEEMVEAYHNEGYETTDLSLLNKSFITLPDDDTAFIYDYGVCDDYETIPGTTTYTLHKDGAEVSSVKELEAEGCDDYETIVETMTHPVFRNLFIAKLKCGNFTRKVLWIKGKKFVTFECNGHVVDTSYKCKGHTYTSPEKYKCNGHDVPQNYIYMAFQEYMMKDVIGQFGLPWNFTLALVNFKHLTASEDDDIYVLEELEEGETYKIKEEVMEKWMFEFATDYTATERAQWEKYDGEYDLMDYMSPSKIDSDDKGLADYILGDFHYESDNPYKIAYPVILVEKISTYIWDYKFEYGKDENGNYYCTSATRTSKWDTFLKQLDKLNISEADVDWLLTILEFMPGSTEAFDDLCKVQAYYEEHGTNIVENVTWYNPIYRVPNKSIYKIRFNYSTLDDTTFNDYGILIEGSEAVEFPDGVNSSRWGVDLGDIFGNEE